MPEGGVSSNCGGSTLSQLISIRMAMVSRMSTTIGQATICSGLSGYISAGGGAGSVPPPGSGASDSRPANGTPNTQTYSGANNPSAPVS